MGDQSQIIIKPNKFIHLSQPRDIVAKIKEVKMQVPNINKFTDEDDADHGLITAQADENMIQQVLWALTHLPET